MCKFEYKVINIENCQNIELIQKTLDDLGSERWELIDSYPSDSRTGLTLVLKRWY